jgi:hypothetical protein
LLDRGAGLFAGVKNILPVSKDLPLTKLVDALMDNKSTPDADGFLYFDPKVAKPRGRISCPFAFVAVVFHSTVLLIIDHQEVPSLPNPSKWLRFARRLCL